MIDAGVAALAHRRALDCGQPGQRYALVGPYLRFAEMAKMVGQITGWPKAVLPMPDFLERPLAWSAGQVDRLSSGRWLEVSKAGVAGGFLQLHIRGDRADHAFGLVHRPPILSIFEALEDARNVGLAPWIKLSKP